MTRDDIIGVSRFGYGVLTPSSRWF